MMTSCVCHKKTHFKIKSGKDLSLRIFEGNILNEVNILNRSFLQAQSQDKDIYIPSIGQLDIVQSRLA